MVAYEFYWRNGDGDEHLIGILPERRKDPKRISKQSVINWVQTMLSDDINTERIFFIQVDV